MKTWIITDTHWNHKNIVGYESRPKDFSHRIFKNWKKLVQSEDRVIHLGDVIFAKQGELGDILNDLPGTKILVRGNHDKQTNEWYMKKGFDFVCDEFRWKNIIFSHKPNLILGDQINIHGHLHEQTKRDSDGYLFFTKNHIPVSIEKNFSPVLLDEIISKFN